MGSRTHNYHRDAMARRGFPEVADRIGELWRAGKKEEAMAAVPEEYLEQNGLFGSVERIRRRWEEGVVPDGVTGIIVGGDDHDAIELMAELVGTRDGVEA
jgi:hypothetical protein